MPWPAASTPTMLHGLVVQEGIEQAHGVGAAADAGDQGIRQAALELLQLLAHFVADDRLEVSHHGGIGVRARRRADDIEGVLDVGHPVAQRLVHGVLQVPRAAFHRHHLGAQQFHAEDVGRLALDVGLAHVDDAGQVEQRADRGRGDAVLAGAGLGDDAGLAHAPGQQDLAHAVVDLVGAGVVQLVALEVDFGAAEVLGQPLGEIERAGAADVVLGVIVDLGLERGVRLGLARRPASTARMSGIRVSATKRPPNRPKCPVSSGPDR